MIRHILSFSLLLVGSAMAQPALAAPDGAAIYQDLCAGCHAASRLGGTGPALIPETLGKMKPDKIAEIIAKGRVATQMAGFAATLSPADIAAVADYVAQPLGAGPGLDSAGY